MKKYIKSSLVALFIISSSAFATQPVNYTCDDGVKLKVAYPNDTHAVMIKQDGDIELFQIAVSASGARYISEDNQWWTKGGEANLSSLKPEDRGIAKPYFGIMCKQDNSTK